MARAQGLTPPALDERLRQDFRQQQFRGSIADTAFVPKTTLDNFIRLADQTREVSVVNLTPDAYTAKVTVTPDQVKAYYDGHVAEFTTPERARVEWPVLTSLERRDARLLGRNGQPLAIPVTVTERPSNGSTVLAADLNLAPLTEGDYVIELTVGTAGATEQRRVAIRVIR